jgi:glutamate formiminotransferase/glutamate formiminotransferase/formiminotetrahydrofolate cyclodeaminase
LLDRTSDPDHHRTVVTFAGPPDAVERAAVEAAGAAVKEIDLNLHAGVHPRMGAIDVIPFVPVSGVMPAECAAMAGRVAEELWSRFRLPGFLYEWAAGGRGLEDVRRAAFAGAAPDVGLGRHATAGAAVVGARRFLVAWNILLETRDVRVAMRIARKIRFSSGGFPGVKALGLPLESRGCVQVSINSTDFEATPLHVVLGAVESEAAGLEVGILGSELIGLIPERALELSAGRELRWLNFEPRMVLERALEKGAD